MQGINSSQLGQSNGFQATCIFSNSIDNITKTVDKTYSELEFEQTPDVIVLQTGQVDLLATNGKSAALKLINPASAIHKKTPQH